MDSESKQAEPKTDKAIEESTVAEKITSDRTTEESTVVEKTTEKDTLDVPTVTKKKASPFLSSEVKKDAKENETVEEENTSLKKQHEHIDKLSKDRSIFNAIGKLYFRSKKTNKLETRGEGKFLILEDNSGMYRLVMIRDQVMLKGCDHYIMPKCGLTKATQVKNSWIWEALCDKSDAEKNEDSTLYFATFKDEETFKTFEEKYNFAREENSKFIKSKETSEK